MVKVEFAEKNDIDIKLNEVLRYLGYRENTPDNQSVNLIESCIEEVRDKFSFKACYDKFPIKLSGDSSIDFGFCTVKSENLKKNLTNCSEILLFAATIGIGLDRSIQKYSNVFPSRSVVMQAIGAAAIEEWCDILCNRFAKIEAENNKFLRPRFSPGYGDFRLEHQQSILQVLDSARKIGVSITDGFLMIPTKSVSAIVGVGYDDLKCIHAGCEVCDNKECEFRRS